VAKLYHQNASDPRDRLRAEFDGLRFLWRHGVRSVPRPLSCEPEQGFAFYEYIQGQAVDSHQAAAADIDQVIGFLITLDGLKGRDDAATLPPASEAFFSMAEVLDNLEQRYARLAQVSDVVPRAGEMLRFLKREFRPLFDHVRKWAQTRWQTAGMAMDRELPSEERTLSPSDVGFHNALRGPDANLCFLDFEYFGWDDPAKMMIDFILHPAMDLRAELKARFWEGLLNHFGRGDRFMTRLSALYPIFGLKWCLIMLNEFIPSEVARRDFAASEEPDDQHRKARQLSRSREMLREVEHTYARDFRFH